MTADILYYVWATLLVVLCAAAWVSTLFTLPGNWAMVLMAAAFAWFTEDTGAHGIGWLTVSLVAILAALGELIEFAASAAGAAKEGASRRAMLLAIVGTVVGSITGAIVGIPIPLVGSIVAALGGGAAGAFAGAYLGETWKGESTEKSYAVSKAALVGRLLGTMGKLVTGIVIVTIISIDAFF